MQKVTTLEPLEKITLSRGELLNSAKALSNLDNVFLPVEKERYWLVKTLSKVRTALKQENKRMQATSNQLVEEFGVYLKDKDGNPSKQKGIEQTDSENMTKYNDAMEACAEELVSIEGVRQIKLEALQGATVSLTIGDQITLQWLIQE